VVEEDLGDIAPLATEGRGLAMVAALSESWGARPDGGQGKVVWFTLPTSAGPVTVPARAPRLATREQPVRRRPEVEPALDGARPPAHAPARSAVAG
jgi:hypothetical protein